MWVRIQPTLRRPCNLMVDTPTKARVRRFSLRNWGVQIAKTRKEGARTEVCGFPLSLSASRLPTSTGGANLVTGGPRRVRGRALSGRTPRACAGPSGYAACAPTSSSL